MEIGGLGLWEIIVVLTVFMLVFGVPVVVALVLFINRRKKANAGMKKCTFCGYSIPINATACQFCGREI
jgi:ABC-type antimicrobial peptide transport system permease subunit